MRTVVQSRSERANLMLRIVRDYERKEAKVRKVAAQDDFNPIPDPAVIAHLREKQEFYRKEARRLAFHALSFPEVIVYVN